MRSRSFYGKRRFVQPLVSDRYNQNVRTAKIAASLLLLTALLFSEKHFNPPPAAHASTYPLHEAHKDENVTIAADPCDTPEKTGVFKVNYKVYGFYPVRLVTVIGNDQPHWIETV